MPFLFSVNMIKVNVEWWIWSEVTVVAGNQWRFTNKVTSKSWKGGEGACVGSLKEIMQGRIRKNN